MPHLRDGYEPILNNMQVHVQSDLYGHRAECVTVDTNPNATVDSVISLFCVQKAIVRSPGLVLFNNNHEPLNYYKTLEAAGIRDGSVVFLGSRKQLIASQPRWGLLAIISMVIGGGGLLAVILLYVLTGGKIPFDFAVVIDAGSTHSQVLLYEWAGDKDSGTADVFQHDTCSVDGGIATSKDPGAEVLQCVNKVVKSIPSASLPHSYLYLGATAGMRLLNVSSPRVAELTLLTLRCSLATAGIVVKTVDMISGVVEGVSAWITTNFLLKNLHPKEDHPKPWISTSGALDMGGASTQYAFAVNPDDVPGTLNFTKIRLYGHNYTIAADTYLCYGLTESMRRHRAMLVTDLNSTKPINDPCLPKGRTVSFKAQNLFDQPCTQTTEFSVWLAENPQNKEKMFQFEGGSNFSNCSALVEKQLNMSVCTETGFQMCAAPPPVFNTEHQFYAVSGYFYITRFLNSTNATLQELVDEIENWCATTWGEMNDLPVSSQDKNMILTYCFGGNYIVQWLTQMYGFNDSTWKNLMFQDKIGEADLGWALGFMINASNAIPEEAPTPPSLSKATFAVIVVLCIFAILISLILARKFLIERRIQKDPEGHQRLTEAL